MSDVHFASVLNCSPLKTLGRFAEIVKDSAANSATKYFMVKMTASGNLATVLADVAADHAYKGDK